MTLRRIFGRLGVTSCSSALPTAVAASSCGLSLTLNTSSSIVGAECASVSCTSSSCCPSVHHPIGRSNLLMTTQRRFAQTLKDIEKHGDKGNSKLLKDLYPEIAMEVDQSAANISLPSAMANTPATSGAVNLNSLMFDSGRRVQWRCKQCKFQWVSSVMSRTILKQGCPSCHRRSNPLVQDVEPKLLQEFHPTKNTIFCQPEALESTERQRLWWLCSNCNCTFQARVCDRVQGKSPCPECDKGQFADFKIRKVLMEEFHPTRNGDLTLAKLRPTDRINVWWLCRECGHEFLTPISLRVSSSKSKTHTNASGSCPKCHAAKQLSKKSRASDVVGAVVERNIEGIPKRKGRSSKKELEAARAADGAAGGGEGGDGFNDGHGTVEGLNDL